MAKTITATVKKRISIGGGTYLYLGTLVPDTEYETGGDTITNTVPPALSLPEKIDFMSIEGRGGGYRAEYVPSSGKIKLLETKTLKENELSALVEVAAKANLSAQTFDYVCIGD
jgi:hypothetical protein